MTVHTWICYDAECALCRRWTARLRPWLRRRGYRCAALQRPAVRTRLALVGVPAEFKLLLPDGRVLGGGDAALHLAGVIDWARPLALVARMLGLRAPLRWFYRMLARNRHRHAGAIAVRRVVRAHAAPPMRTARKRAFDAAWIGALAQVLAPR